jgi:LPS-assembly protein
MGRVHSKTMGKLRLAMLVGSLLALFAATPAWAELIPRSFFDNVPTPGGPARVEANTLAYDAKSDVITASGNVVMLYGGYVLECDQLRYEQGSGALVCIGSAKMTSPEGNVAQADTLNVTGGMKEAFLESLTVTTPSGAMITASEANYSSELQNILHDASYSPCGECIDANGRLIGWRVRADKLTQNATTGAVEIQNGRLDIVGVPIAWLPWLSIPDPTKPSTGFRLPTVDYDASRGLRAGLPYFVSLDQENSLLLTPQLMTRQGFLFAAEWEHKFAYGAVSVYGSGIYQLDPGAYAGSVGDRHWRGSVGTEGDFELPEGWTAGWSYTAFSDAAYLPDYSFEFNGADDVLINEAYVGFLDDDTYADVRVQQYQILGNYTDADEAKQATTMPNARADQYFNSETGDQIHLSARVLSVHRGDDALDILNAVPYVFGYSGDKTHLALEGTWQKQLLTSSGLVATPLMGLRADAASYSGDAPVEESSFSVTPLAAIDLRYPLISSEGDLTQVVEPIAQIVYRGSDETSPGITNDDSHSFLLDENNLFALNKFASGDRQDTGLRANIGARYLATLSNGSWLELTAGQSFLLAGQNGPLTDDEMHSGLNSASYIVLGAQGNIADALKLGAKLLVDPTEGQLERAGLGGDIAVAKGVTFGGDYIFLPADADHRIVEDLEEVTLRAKAPLSIDYWSAIGSLSWDLSRGEWLEVRGELVYDDGFVEAGAFAKATGDTHDNANDLTVGLSMKLKGPDGLPAF